MASKPIKSLAGKELSGELTKAIIPSRRPSLAYGPGSKEWDDYCRALHDEVSGKRLEKLLLLAQHYGVRAQSLQDINPMSYFFLFYSLARDCVPGFAVTFQRHGQPKTRDASFLRKQVEMMTRFGLAKDHIEARKLIAQIELEIEHEDAAKEDGRTKRRVNSKDVEKRARTIADEISAAKKRDRQRLATHARKLRP